jgi:diacylglycerol kinase (ATP)
MPGIAVLSNPRSGTNRRNPLLVRKLAYVLGDAGELVQPPSLDELEATVRDLRARGVETVCVNGGDGTLHKVLSALVRVYAEGATGDALRAVRLPQIAILKGGTVNTMARNIRLKAGADAMLGRVVDAAHGGPPLRLAERSAIVVNGQHAGFLFGTGILYRFMKMYNEGAPPGRLKALKVLAHVVLSGLVGGPTTRALFHPDPARVLVDGAPWPASRYPAVAVGTMNDIGLGFEVFHAAREHLDHVHALGFIGGPMSAIRSLPRIYLGRPTRHPEILDQVARELIIEGEAAQGFMMDGDFLPGGPALRVEAGPRVRFLLP